MIFKKKTIIERKQADSPGYISQMLSGAQHKAANYLNSKTAGWSMRRLKIMLILFCVLGGAMCLCTMGKAILSANGPPSHSRVQHPPVLQRQDTGKTIHH